MRKPEPESVRRIMGIDPGTNRMGYGIVDVRGGELKCVVTGDVELGRLADPYAKLKYIFDRVCSLTDEFAPSEVALESPFFGVNVQSMLKLGRAQGVAMAAALTRGLPVFEYAPRRIKQSITGRGAASKEQVAVILRAMLGVEYDVRRLDATDGLAVAVCHHFESCSVFAGSGGKVNALGGGPKARSRGGSASWEQFVSKNPDRVSGNSSPRKTESFRREEPHADKTRPKPPKE